MKKVGVLFVAVLLFFACSENKKQTVELADKTAGLSKNVVTESASELSIPLFDFDAFEKKFLQNIDDKTYVINFWATWCKPCVKELPAFEQLHSEYEDKNVEVILVSLDFPEKVESHVIPFVEKKGLRSKVVLLDDPNANNWIPRVSKDWSGAIPATLIVKNGITKFYERSFTFTDLENELKTLL